MHSTLTVEENLMFAARYRLPAHYRREQHLYFVERAIQVSRLWAVAVCARPWWDEGLRRCWTTGVHGPHQSQHVGPPCIPGLLPSACPAPSSAQRAWPPPPACIWRVVPSAACTRTCPTPTPSGAADAAAGGGAARADRGRRDARHLGGPAQARQRGAGAGGQPLAAVPGRAHGGWACFPCYPLPWLALPL